MILLIVAAATVYIYSAFQPASIPTRRDALGVVSTFAGSGSPGGEDGKSDEATFADPFGVAVDSEGNVIIADAGANNLIRRVTKEGAVETIAGSAGDGEGYGDGPALSSKLNTPSGIAINDDGEIIIADTSNNRIRKLSSDKQVSTVAGTGAPGYRDGAAKDAQFDGPIGLAVDEAGNIFVADSYNDRIRKISVDGIVSTVAGAGQPGHLDGQADSALFDTPCGVAVDKQGNVFVADTANDRVRKITSQGEVTTLADEAAGLDRPVGLAVTHDGFIFVTSEGGGRIHRITPEGEATLYSGHATGFMNGAGERARFNSPTGITVDRQGNLFVADSQNYLVRRVTPTVPEEARATEGASEPFVQPVEDRAQASEQPAIPILSATALGISQTFPWPLNPQNQWHEVTGVVGEARGAPGGVALHHLHSGLDVRGNLGETVVSVLDEKVGSPVAAWGFEGGNEGVRVGLMSYIHIRVGRDASGNIRTAEKFKPRLDSSGKLAGIRVRRGTRFRVGEFIGTLNRLYHVHLNFGPWNAQANPMQFPFVNFKDSVPPVIEPNGVELFSATGSKFEKGAGGRFVLSGDVRIVVTAYDRVDGNVASRKLGLHKLGYQFLKEDGSPTAGFREPLINIDFTRLPPDDGSVFKVYASGSGVSAYGTPTKFKYIATNRVRDGAALDGYLATSRLEPGDYKLKIIAEDFQGNRASGPLTEVLISIERR